MATILSANAFIDYAYYNSIFGTTYAVTDEKLIILINTVTEIFETVCNRFLKARDFSYISTDVAYNPEFSIFDPPEKDIFYFPTYPVNTLTTFKISGTIITSATDYDGDDGYVLYNNIGKLVYTDGFDFGYFKNIETKWNGGYASGSHYYSSLQYWSALAVNKFLNNPVDSELVSESIGNYKYTKNPEYLSQFKGLFPDVYLNLLQLRKREFA